MQAWLTQGWRGRSGSLTGAGDELAMDRGGVAATGFGDGYAARVLRVRGAVVSSFPGR